MPIIAISGKRRSGKSTLAGILLRKYGYTPVSIADSLKELCREHFGLTYDQTDGVFKEQPTHYKAPNGEYWTPREIMIHMGATYRKIDPDFWIKKLGKRMEDESGESHGFVIPDVRFMNEMVWMERLGAVSVRLERSEDLTGEYIDDRSETDLDTYTKWDVKIPADENIDLSDLEAAAVKVQMRVELGSL